MADKLNSKNFSESLLLDTNIVIYQLNGKIDLAGDLAHAKKLYLSALTIAELYAGVSRSQIKDLEEYLVDFSVLPVTTEVASLAGGYKNALPQKNLKDLIIAATAQTYHLRLVTANKKDFFGILSLKPIYVSL